MKHSLIMSALLAAATLAFTPKAEASMYITGSLSSTQSHLGFSEYQSQYGSASIGFDLWRYLRLSFSHSQELSISQGYKDPDADPDAETDATTDDDPSNDGQLVEFYSRTLVVGNSADLQLILYEGQVFVPYVMGGLIVKNYTIETREEGKADSKKKKGPIPGPNVGLGLGIRLNKEFTLKFSYIGSIGATQKPFDASETRVWDRKVTFGLTYQL